MCILSCLPVLEKSSTRYWLRLISRDVRKISLCQYIVIFYVTILYPSLQCWTTTSNKTWCVTDENRLECKGCCDRFSEVKFRFKNHNINTYPDISQHIVSFPLHQGKYRIARFLSIPIPTNFLVYLSNKKTNIFKVFS